MEPERVLRTSASVLSLVATGTSGASSFWEGGHEDVLVQPNDPHLREGTSTLNRRASYTHARWAPGLRDVRERVRQAAPLGHADRESPGVGGPRGALKAPRSHAGAVGGARGASEQEEEGEAEFRGVRAPIGAAPPGGGQGSPIQ